MNPSESKMRSRLRHTISLSTPLDCRQSQALQTSCEMKRRLFPGCASIISLIVLMSCLLTDLLRYVMIVSIPDTINHQGLERKLILKKNCAEVVNLKFKRLLPVNGYLFLSLGTSILISPQLCFSDSPNKMLKNCDADFWNCCLSLIMFFCFITCRPPFVDLLSVPLQRHP